MEVQIDRDTLSSVDLVAQEADHCDMETNMGPSEILQIARSEVSPLHVYWDLVTQLVQLAREPGTDSDTQKEFLAEAAETLREGRHHPGLYWPSRKEARYT